MPTLRIPTPLRTYTSGQSEVNLSGNTVGEIMNDLVIQYPSLRPHLFNGENQLRPFVNLFINEENIREMDGLATLLQEGDRVMLIPSIAGGRA